MSRTYKHTPFRVLYKKAMQENFLFHNHFVDLSPYLVENEKVFFKGDSKAINEYQSFLDGLDYLVSVKKTEKKAKTYYTKSVSENGEHARLITNVIPATVTFTIQYYVKSRWTEFCTDAEHDVNGFDSRDGGVTTCGADVSDYLASRGEDLGDYFSEYKGFYEYHKPKRRQEPVYRNIVNAYNSGLDIEDIEDEFIDSYRKRDMRQYS